MISIEYPSVNFKIREQNGYEEIWDAIRRKWVKLTPEEWVRQNFLNYLTIVKQYPASLIAIEKEVQLLELKKRCDIVLYKDEQPWMIVECKALNVQLSEQTVEQILRYNLSIPVPFLIITNGNTTFGWERKNGNLLKIHALPGYQE